MRHVLAVSGGASSPDSDDESTRASQRRKPPAHAGHPALPDVAVVPLAPVRESHHRVEALAWNSDDGGARETPPATSHDDRSADEGRSCCVTRLGGRQRLRAFTGELGLDLEASLNVLEASLHVLETSPSVLRPRIVRRTREHQNARTNGVSPRTNSVSPQNE